MQAAHEPTQGEVISWCLVVERCSTTEVGITDLGSGVGFSLDLLSNSVIFDRQSPIGDGVPNPKLSIRILGYIGRELHQIPSRRARARRFSSLIVIAAAR